MEAIRYSSISYKFVIAVMARIQRHPKTGKYGLRIERINPESGNASLQEVYAPNPDEEHGCDWSTCTPSAKVGNNGAIE